MKYFNSIININKIPIIISGNASWDELTIWEQLAKEKGIRSEILYVKRKVSIQLINSF